MDYKMSRHIWKSIAEYLVLIGIICISMYLVFHLKDAAITRYPLAYGIGGDGMTGLVTAKSMLQNGWIYQNPYIGAPGNGTNYDAVTMELMLSLIEQCLVTLTHNWILGYNLFYLSSYILIGITSFYALKQLELETVIALPSAVLYAFAPYHQMRGIGHLYLGMYFMVPLIVLYMYRLMKKEQLFRKGRTIFKRNGSDGWITIPNILRIVCIMCMALTGIYYAFFACFFFCVVIFYKLLNQNNSKKAANTSLWSRIKGSIAIVIQPLICILTIVVTLILAAIPNLIYWLQYGRPEGLLSKGGEGAELYALKIVQMLLPIMNHRIPFFAKVRTFYDTYYPLVNENGFASLGIYMAVGFLVLCIALFMRYRLSEESDIRIGSVYTLAAILFGSIGGFAAVLSFFVTAIRCYNRFSIFIAMFSLIATAKFIQMIYHKKRHVIVTGILMLFIMAVGLLDQTPAHMFYYEEAAAAYETDAQWIQSIDALLEDGAMVYQMPYMQYPENGAIQNMQDYSHFVGYIHSDSIRWSYGTVVGRETDQWQRTLQTMPLAEEIQTIQNAGFAGIYIDWNAYLPDERQEIEACFQSMGMERAAADSIQMREFYIFP